MTVRLDSGGQFLKVKASNLRVTGIDAIDESLKIAEGQSNRSDSDLLSTGQRVVIHGLVSAPAFNDCQGMLGEFVPAEGRWYVKLGQDLRDGIKQALLKPTNLRLASVQDDEKLIGRFVRRKLGNQSFIGRVTRFHLNIGFFVRYEDGDREHCSADEVVGMLLLLEERDQSRLAAMVGRYPESASDDSEGEGFVSKKDLEYKIIPEMASKASMKPKSDDASDVEMKTHALLPNRNADSLEGCVSKPVVFFHPWFEQHKGGGQDQGGLWLKGIRDRLGERGLWGDLEWIDSATEMVSIDRIAASGVHSLSYLQGLVQIDRRVKDEGQRIDLARGKVIKMLGRAWAACDSECIMDVTTLDAVMLRVAITRDALFSMLSDKFTSGFVLARPACHHVPCLVEAKVNNHCDICNQTDRANKMLICDSPGCLKAYHIFCLSPPLDEEKLTDPVFLKEPWLCPRHEDKDPKESPLMRSPARLLHKQVDELEDFPPELNLKAGDEISCGFCFVNATAFSVIEAKTRFPGVKIAIVDFDVHAGNGNEHVFYRDPEVLHISVHRFGDTADGHRIMPASGHYQDVGSQDGFGFNLNVEMRLGDGNAEYCDVAREIVVPVLLQFKPEVVVLLCGFDALDHSLAPSRFVGPGMDCSVTPLWYWWLVLELREKAGIKRLLCTTEGGYDPKAASVAGECLVRGLRGEQLPPGFASEVNKSSESVTWRNHLEIRKRFFKEVRWTQISL